MPTISMDVLSLRLCGEHAIEEHHRKQGQDKCAKGVHVARLAKCQLDMIAKIRVNPSRKVAPDHFLR